MSQQTIVITGANSGIGKAAAEELARKGARVVMLCRSAGKAEEARDEIRRNSGSDSVDVVSCDLTSFDSIRRAAGEVRENYPRIDVLLNNAGLVLSSRNETTEGFETQFGTNHLGHFLLTHLLMPTLEQSGAARIVNVSSGAHWLGALNFNDLEMKRAPYIGFLQYCRTKFMNILFTRELARRLKGTPLTANCLHPGGVNTNFAVGAMPKMFDFARNFMITPDQGARTSVFLATSPSVSDVSGEYFSKCKQAASHPRSKNMKDAARLWKISEEMCGIS